MINSFSISDKLEEFRKAQKDFYDLSFDTICAYKENAALMHYKAEPGKCATVTNEGLLLIDSGGQYFDGTTDITRTFVLGNISDIERRDYTVALKALLRLQDARFIAGTTGPNLDLFAREMVYKYVYIDEEKYRKGKTDAFCYYECEPDILQYPCRSKQYRDRQKYGKLSYD